MARHRVGDSYLSEEEYDEHISTTWKGCLFLIGALVAGIACYFFTKDMGWPKYVRFSSIIFSAIATGYMLAKISEIIRTIVAIIIVGGILAIVGAVIWDQL